MMNYKDLKNRAEARNILIKELAESLDMTANGFKVSIERETFPIGKVSDLCNALGVTINQFFGKEYNDADISTLVTAESLIGYGTPVAYHGSETNMMATLINHIRWLEREIDRLRAENERLTNK